MSIPPVQRFQFKIDPATPLKDLLPAPPKITKTSRPVLVENLSRVPEVQFAAPLAKDVSNPEAARQTAHQIAKINHLNGKKADGFLKALRGERTDLSGLPFAMGDACRTKGERSRQFKLAVTAVRRALRGEPQSPINIPITDSSSALAGAVVRSDLQAADFWQKYQAGCLNEDKTQSQADRAQREVVILARVAALMQVLAPESPSMRLGLVNYLATLSHAEATRALARLAIFSAEDEVRNAAVDALKVRRERDYTEVLLRGLRYPLPAVARRAADAVARLERTDLLPQLVDVLDEPDPRAPTLQEIDQKKVPVVRELVRVNHHRNCLLCHAPGNTGQVSPEAITAAVPLPGESLPSFSTGYQNSSPDLLVRVDVTYLRQDFSLLQPVADANPWPEMQRFDFLVRTRVLAEPEAKAYREAFEKQEPGRLSPYHRAVLAALRELTGRDTEPTPQAWRRLLKLPQQQRKGRDNRSRAACGLAFARQVMDER